MSDFLRRLLVVLHFFGFFISSLRGSNLDDFGIALTNFDSVILVEEELIRFLRAEEIPSVVRLKRSKQRVFLYLLSLIHI